MPRTSLVEAGWLPALPAGSRPVDVALNVLPLCVFQCEQYESLRF